MVLDRMFGESFAYVHLGIDTTTRRFPRVGFGRLNPEEHLEWPAGAIPYGLSSHGPLRPKEANHGNKSHELHRSEGALFSSRRDEESLNLRELLRKKERAPPTPTPPEGLRKTLSPDSALFPPGSSPLPSPRRADSKITKTNGNPPALGKRTTTPYEENFKKAKHQRKFGRP